MISKVSEENIKLFMTATRELQAHTNHLTPVRIQEAFAQLTYDLPNECDVWVGYVESGVVTEEALYNIATLWDNRYNVCRLAKLPAGPANPFIYTESLYVPIRVQTRDYAWLVYSSVLIDNEKYAAANEIIAPILAAHPYMHEARWMAAILAFSTHRWEDMLRHLEYLKGASLPLLGNAEEQTPQYIEALHALANLHLDRLVDCSEILASFDTAKGDFRFLGESLRALSGFVAAPHRPVLFNSYDSSSARSPVQLRYNKWFWDNIVAGHKDVLITSVERIAARSDYWDHEGEPTSNPSSEQEESINREVVLREADAELESFYGLDLVKQQVRHLRNIIKTNQIRKERNLPVTRKTQHLIFEGPPGTGKTTIARVIAKIYYGLQVTDKESITEVTRAEIVGQHIGETEAKVNALVDKALGGVLFIDEAYALVATGAKNDFGLVAINTLLTRMENERDKIIVIIAGYAEDLLALLEANEGLRSRFKEKISFNSYSPDELVGMAKLMCTPRGTILSEESLILLGKVCATLENVTINDSNKVKRRAIDIAGNARFIRNILERAEDVRDARLGSLADLSHFSDEQLQTVTLADASASVTSVLNILRIKVDINAMTTGEPQLEMKTVESKTLV